MDQAASSKGKAPKYKFGSTNSIGGVLVNNSPSDSNAVDQSRNSSRKEMTNQIRRELEPKIRKELIARMSEPGTKEYIQLQKEIEGERVALKAKMKAKMEADIERELKKDFGVMRYDIAQRLWVSYRNDQMEGAKAEVKNEVRPEVYKDVRRSIINNLNRLETGIESNDSSHEGRIVSSAQTPFAPPLAQPNFESTTVVQSIEVPASRAQSYHQRQPSPSSQRRPKRNFDELEGIEEVVQVGNFGAKRRRHALPIDHTHLYGQVSRPQSKSRLTPAISRPPLRELSRRRLSSSRPLESTRASPSFRRQPSLPIKRACGLESSPLRSYSFYGSADDGRPGHNQASYDLHERGSEGSPPHVSLPYSAQYNSSEELSNGRGFRSPRWSPGTPHFRPVSAQSANGRGSSSPRWSPQSPNFRPVSAQSSNGRGVRSPRWSSGTPDFRVASAQSPQSINGRESQGSPPNVSRRHSSLYNSAQHESSDLKQKTINGSGFIAPPSSPYSHDNRPSFRPISPQSSSQLAEGGPSFLRASPSFLPRSSPSFRSADDERSFRPISAQSFVSDTDYHNPKHPLANTLHNESWYENDGGVASYGVNGLDHQASSSRFSSERYDQDGTTLLGPQTSTQFRQIKLEPEGDGDYLARPPQYSIADSSSNHEEDSRGYSRDYREDSEKDEVNLRYYGARYDYYDRQLLDSYDRFAT